MTVDIIRSKSRQKRGPRKVYEFGLEFYRADEPEVHEFKAYPVLDAGSLNFTLSATRKPERAVEGIVRSIRKMLADDDEARERVHAEDTNELDLDELEDDDTLYTGPDGEPILGDAVREALKMENGSSRRRFDFLMDEDEDLTLEADQLQTAYQKLVSRAADRPTRR